MPTALDDKEEGDVLTSEDAFAKSGYDTPHADPIPAERKTLLPIFWAALATGRDCKSTAGSRCSMAYLRPRQPCPACPPKK